MAWTFIGFALVLSFAIYVLNTNHQEKVQEESIEEYLEEQRRKSVGKTRRKIYPS